MSLRPLVPAVAVFASMLTVAACGEQREATPPTAAAPPAAPAPPTPATTLTLLEPIDGAMGGHIDTFRWSPIEGADGYVIRIVAVTGNRLVWESAPMTETETRLPDTVALEPEAHSWSVSARKGTDVLATSPTQKFTITP